MHNRTLDISIDGVRVQLTKMPVFTALRLDKRLCTMIAPALSGLEGLDFKNLTESDIDLGMIGKSISEALQAIPDHDLIEFIKQMGLYATDITDGHEVDTFDKESTLSVAFGDNLMGIYKLLIEIAKFNKFLPFAFSSFGNKIKTTPM